MNSDAPETVVTVKETILSEEPQQQQHHHAPPEKRTKLVFLYSSDEEEDDNDKKDGEESNENINEGSKKSAVAVEEVVTLNPPVEELLEMQQEAEEAAARQKRVEEQNTNEMIPPMPLFVEDTAGVAVKLPTVPQTRVKVVDALPLREGGINTIGKRSGMPLRRYISVEEAERLLIARKRFREEEEEKDDDDNEEENGEDSVVVVANGFPSGVDSNVCVPRPVLDDDGLVRAVEVGGYQLTVDESYLQNSDEEKEDVEEGEVIALDTVNENDEDNNYKHLGDENNDDLDNLGDLDDDDEEEEEDEEDEELDAALVVAVVEQLVRCCESEELDEALREDGDRFLARAQPFLQQLHAGEMDPHAFGEELRSDILRLQRAFRRVSRPTDAPIVIDGVVMDM
ncbi:uncharacterized protein TM35_000241640 [Trypanosoma theileri]|uniref:Uncharacterized protein n=1 Tax=Trypanosoma theileri TaxID=67003 RepID=A0A1X0NQP3_9TRYP|nr:uncharacterized protein TM35_000241640 [Trypanosoma theileri]ORC87014.1 hypothetical protein TM35_000241640 [Trypanosoma theileri]